MDMDQVKINKLEIENVKRVKAVKLEPSPSGLTVIGGKNRQGKTSVLDAIAWALGGNKFRPTQAQNADSVIPPTLKLTLSNGLVVERKGKNSDLKVTDPSGRKSGQQLLDSFVSELALNLPKFMTASPAEKAETLLDVIGVKDQLAQLQQQITLIYNQRLAIGQIADQKAKFAKEQAYYPDAPSVPVSAAALIRQQQDILARNGENQRKRQQLQQLKLQHDQTEAKMQRLSEEIAQLQARLADTNQRWHKEDADIQIAEKTVAQLQDESTAALEASLQNVEEINAKVRANLDKDKAEDDAKQYRAQYDTLTNRLEAVRDQKRALLNSAKLPLPGLTVEDGQLMYQGFNWDSMSGADQLKVSTAIVRAINPKCGFVLLDKLEQMDLDSLAEFGQWLEQEGLQAIATRVSTGAECSIIITDGRAEAPETEPAAAPAAKWEAKY